VPRSIPVQLSFSFVLGHGKMCAYVSTVQEEKGGEYEVNALLHLLENTHLFS